MKRGWHYWGHSWTIACKVSQGSIVCYLYFIFGISDLVLCILYEGWSWDYCTAKQIVCKASQGSIVCIWYFIFGICYLIFGIQCLVFSISYLLFCIKVEGWYLVFHICYLIFGIFYIWYLVFCMKVEAGIIAKQIVCKASQGSSRIMKPFIEYQRMMPKL